MIKLYAADIRCLYDGFTPIEDTFDMVELGTLPDAVECTVAEALNGEYELYMVYLATGVNASQITTDRIIEVDCPGNNTISKNLFRVYTIRQDNTGRMYIYARHIAFDLIYYTTYNSAAGSYYNITTFENYINTLRGYSSQLIPFIFSSDTNSVSYKMNFRTMTNTRNYLVGDNLFANDKSALEIFGGEYLYERYYISLQKRRGQERSTVIHYAVNMSGIEIDDDLDGVYTTFVLYYQTEDRLITSSPKNTSYASLFPYKRTMLVDWTFFVVDGDSKTDEQIYAELQSASTTYAENHDDLGNPIQRINVDVVAAGLDEIYLGDTVPVVYNRHGYAINTKMRVVSYVWDVLMQRYITVTLGAQQSSLAQEIALGAVTSEETADNFAHLTGRVSTLESQKVGLEVVSANGGTGYKFSDGTLICAKTVTVTATVNKGWGSLFYNENLASLGDWPVQFLNTPAATISQTGGSDVTGISWHSMSAVSAGSVYLYRPVSTVSQSYTLSAIAIGRWK